MAGGVSIRIDVDAGQLRGGLRALQEAALDPTEAFDVIGRRWVDLTRERFAQGNAPDGTPWKPSQRALRDGGQTLVDKRRLEGSITHEADPEGVTIGTNVVYAAAHQFGATIVPKNKKRLRFFVPGAGWVFAKKVTLPPRPFIGFNQSYGEEFAEILVNFLERKAREGAGGAPGGAAA